MPTTKPRDPNPYKGTEYARKAFVIDERFYDDVLMKLANEDPRRVIKVGDVVKVLYNLVQEHAPEGTLEEALEVMRGPQDAQKLAQDIKGASPEVQARIRELLANAQ
jgi:hypothetical protein